MVISIPQERLIFNKCLKAICNKPALTFLLAFFSFLPSPFAQTPFVLTKADLPAPEVTFSEVPITTPLNGRTINGFTFSEIFGITRVFNVPLVANNITNPSALGLNNQPGQIITITLPGPRSGFGFGYSLDETVTDPIAVTVTLFNGAVNLGSLTYTGSLDPTYAGGYAGIGSTVPFTSVKISFNAAVNSYVFDNISTISNILPLRLLTLTANRERNNTTLNWTTSQEIDVDRFEIERSFNAIEYRNMGQVKAGLTSYTFRDINLKNVIAYYRLKMIDKDGKFTYSKVVIVTSNNLSKAEIYPNPVTSTATIKLQSTHTENVTLKIANSEGKVLSTKTYKVLEGNNLIPLNTLNLTSGIYIIVISGQHNNEQLTFRKQ